MKPPIPLYLSHFDEVVVLVALLLEGRAPDLARLVQQVHGEEVALALGVAPAPDVGLVRHPTTTVLICMN